MFRSPLIGTVPASPAGPIGDAEARRLPAPPTVSLPAPCRFCASARQIELLFGARRRLGEVFALRGTRSDQIVVTSHPDHVRSLVTARPGDASSLTGESPLRPIVGPGSVLTATGPRHLRQRKLAFDAARQRGVVLHMLGALPLGRLGLTAVGDSAADAQRRFERAGALVLEAGARAVPVAA
jgi:hypothetical protein